MTRSAIVAVSAILAANLTLAQDVETPPVFDPSVVLSRALAKLAETTARLQRYTCLETIQRAYYFQPLRKLGRKVKTEAPQGSCDGIGFHRDGHLLLDSEDRLRLQVAVSNGEEIDSWANASRFDSRSILELIPVGPASTGAFGTSLHDIFGNPGVLYTYGREQIEQRFGRFCWKQRKGQTPTINDQTASLQNGSFVKPPKQPDFSSG
jgi:hypothetical protein